MISTTRSSQHTFFSFFFSFFFFFFFLSSTLFNLPTTILGIPIPCEKTAEECTITSNNTMLPCVETNSSNCLIDSYDYLNNCCDSDFCACAIEFSDSQVVYCLPPFGKVGYRMRLTNHTSLQPAPNCSSYSFQTQLEPKEPNDSFELVSNFGCVVNGSQGFEWKAKDRGNGSYVIDLTSFDFVMFGSGDYYFYLINRDPVNEIEYRIMTLSQYCPQ